MSGFAGVIAASAKDHDFRTEPGNLLLSRVLYDNNPNNVSVGSSLPPGCAPANCVTAVNNGVYPYVFNNAPIDGSFGITSKIVLDQLTPHGERISSFEVPNSSQPRVTSTADQMVGSFSSKSEVALNLSTNGNHVTFMGYYAPIDTLDVSNSNTPGVFDKTNPVPSSFYRVVADLDREGDLHFTATNAYSGNNGRAAILHPYRWQNLIYTAGNAGNGGNPQPPLVIVAAGAQGLLESSLPLYAQNPGTPTPFGSFNVTQLGDKADKIGKDDNFRGLTIFNNVVYLSKGSGGNGVDTVYFIDNGPANGQPSACATDGTGLPAPSATLPTTPLAIPSNVQTAGLPSNMCILKGFPTELATTSTNSFPFGIWFANVTTLYVADEGDGTNTYDASTNTYTDAAAQTRAGLQKWVLQNGEWTLVYTLQAGLNLGTPYTIKGYPTGLNTGYKGLPWSPATDGLRNLTGRVNDDGTVTIWAITSTVSGSGDQGADPNKFVVIQDKLAATTLPANESFRTVQTARFAEVLRGVSFTPGTDRSHGYH
ncbi:MAG TPA: hypothetical protein VEK34_09905 [Methylocella sp.]|nr:hypothetical protein [Methylocella sp.]